MTNSRLKILVAFCFVAFGIVLIPRQKSPGFGSTGSPLLEQSRAKSRDKPGMNATLPREGTREAAIASHGILLQRKKVPWTLVRWAPLEPNSAHARRVRGVVSLPERLLTLGFEITTVNGNEAIVTDGIYFPRFDLIQNIKKNIVAHRPLANTSTFLLRKYGYYGVTFTNPQQTPLFKGYYEEIEELIRLLSPPK